MLNLSSLSVCLMERHERIARAIAQSGKKKGQIAEECGVSPSSVTQWVSGESKGLKPENLFALANATGFNPQWLAVGDGPERAGDAAPGSPSEKDYALIPQYTAKGSAGNGHLNEHVEIKGGLAFKRDWLSRLGVKEHRCSVIYAHGSSMEPSIFDGEVVLIDHDDTEPRDAKVYVLQRPDGEIIIKRLIKQMAGWVIRSDNEDKRRFPDEPISADSLQHIEVVGRVVWRGGGM